jgi:predicted dehydrogenase
LPPLTKPGIGPNVEDMTRLGIIGNGSMANTHAKNFRQMPDVALTACCDIVEARARDFAHRWGIPQWYTDCREMLEREKLDAVSNVTVDAAHAPVSLEVISRGLPVLCEKPLATTLADAKRMRDAASKKGVVNMVNFSYRNAASLQAAAAYVRGGGIGRILHAEASYLQSWLVQDRWGDWRTNTALTWRLSARHGSAGTLGDIGCHIYDMISFLCGDIVEISCRLAAFDKGIPGNRIGEYVFDANDSFASTVVFRDGGMATVHATRWATGHHNSLRARVYGDEGAVEVDLDRGTDRYRVVKGRKAMREAAWKEVVCRPTPSQYQRFIRCVKKGKNDVCDFSVGAKVQAYLHGSIQSDRERRPVRVKA